MQDYHCQIIHNYQCLTLFKRLEYELNCPFFIDSDKLTVKFRLAYQFNLQVEIVFIFITLNFKL